MRRVKRKNSGLFLLVVGLTGQMLFAQSINALSREFYLKNKGVYILQVQTRDGEIHRSKIINQ